VTIIILACFKTALDVHGEYNQLDAIWRIQMGLSLVPAFATLWPRLTMPEGKKFTQSKELNTRSSSNSTKPESTVTSPELPKVLEFGNTNQQSVSRYEHDTPDSVSPVASLQPPPDGTETSKWSTFFIYFRKWKHLKTLLGTTSCWFLLDIAFYGTNLNQSVLLTEIGFSKGKNEYEVLMRNALGNLIIAAAGYVPGYFFTIWFVEKLGRRWIQIQGFMVCALVFGILAGDYAHLGTAGKFVCFAIAQVRSRPISYLPVMRKTLIRAPFAVLLQLRPQRNYVHHPR
jgi:MFS transporter, PHS family, inorganic phosphate transporter